MFITVRIEKKYAIKMRWATLGNDLAFTVGIVPELLFHAFERTAIDGA